MAPSVAICGGGNAAHVAAAMFSKKGADVRMYLSMQKEADALNAGIAKNNGITVIAADETYTAKPSLVSHEASKAIPGVDMVLIITPAFAHEPILSEIAPHLQSGAVVGAIPAPGGFDWLAKNKLGANAEGVTVFGGTSLPWACRIEQYGEKVSLLGAKSHVPITICGESDDDHKKVLNTLNSVFEKTQFGEGGHFLNTTLFPTNAIVHPGIMYGLWHDWDGKPLKEAPLFYQGTTEFTGQIMDGLSDDIQATQKALNDKLGLGLTIPKFHDYICDVYAHEVKDKTSTMTALQTNNAFRGLTCPMVKQDDGTLLPNFQFRYLAEDLPHGLVVLKGVAEVVGVSTPTFDKVLAWGQEKLGKTYLVDGKLTGPDVAGSGAPQRWGITKVEELK